MEKHYNALKKIIPEGRIFFGKELADMLHYGIDRSGKFKADPGLLIFPKSTGEVKKIVEYCYRNNIAIVPSGGRTGYSGGALAGHKEIVISLEKMSRVINFNASSATITVEAGMVTESINALTEKSGLFFPVEFAATGSSHIGGNLSTNAGGHRVIRYGTTRNWILGLTMVDGAGNILTLGGEFLKDVSGYDLKQLVIGAEGTLGIVTEVTLRLTKVSGDSKLFFLAISSYEKLLALFELSRTLPLPTLSFEFFTEKCLVEVMKDNSEMQNPFDRFHPIYALIEIENHFPKAFDQSVPEHILDKFLEKLLENELIEDGILAANSIQEKTLWKYRENISEALSLRYTVHKNDISIPLAQIGEFIIELEEMLKKAYPDFETAIFGHVGDGNLHVNIIKPEKMSNSDFFNQAGKSDHIVFQLIQKFQGSISAEHGIGILKKDFLGYNHSKREMEILRGIKKLFDPKNIINPGKVIDILFAKPQPFSKKHFPEKQDHHDSN